MERVDGLSVLRNEAEVQAGTPYQASRASPPCRSTSRLPFRRSPARSRRRSAAHIERLQRGVVELPGAGDVCDADGHMVEHDDSLLYNLITGHMVMSGGFPCQPDNRLVSPVDERPDLCLEFANTRYWRGQDPPTETLNAPADLAAWTKAPKVPAQKEFERALEAAARDDPSTVRCRGPGEGAALVISTG